MMMQQDQEGRRPKDSFQMSFKVNLKRDDPMGLSAEITDSDEDGFNTFHNYKSKPSKEQRSGSAKKGEKTIPQI
ncbi:hypothetical protein Btru_060614 [Bulinus truncatus]|nr:hypothetical protein Btru_060614 [Bulinus truncatus]